ncbi:hypothetical protein P280DRAFT_474652 [Massarina eburnea CBS 473.64]|uniref:Uncharacterized protein n=1 Tax=Massarina eburnea CBS 473.64 TaxID=1395130 RepID=A0A6A6RK62_9PLEO|nr:hypothetical protein P280DRAFT_474652 [Massarina eburnea CBS 473.64]
MVAAALCVSKDTTFPKRFATADDGEMALNNSLNWHEAHDLYAWPAFTSLGFDFAQAMRMRRALVHDTFCASQKASALNTGVSGFSTPESQAQRGDEETAQRRNGYPAKRPRPSNCPHDTEGHDSNGNEPFWHNKRFLADAMLELIDHTTINVDDYFEGDMTIEALADIVRSGLIEQWKLRKTFEPKPALDGIY